MRNKEEDYKATLRVLKSDNVIHFMLLVFCTVSFGLGCLFMYLLLNAE